MLFYVGEKLMDIFFAEFENSLCLGVGIRFVQIERGCFRKTRNSPAEISSYLPVTMEPHATTLIQFSKQYNKEIEGI